MGNWHCIPSSCATVHYREYLAPKIRWRYPNEPWQEIEGDDYKLQTIKKYCPGLNYRLYYSRANIVNGTLASWTNFSIGFPQGVSNQVPFSNIRLVVPNIGTYYFFEEPIFHWAFRDNGIPPDGSRTRMYQVVIDTSTQANVVLLTTVNNGARIDDIRPDEGVAACPPDCLFKIYKNGQTVYTETRAVCPEVQKIPCQLSTVNKQIEIEKLPYLDRIEVVPYFYDVRWGLLTDSSNYGFLLAKGKIPDHCLNIYNNGITSTIPNDFFQIANTPENGYKLITQICSAPGCPPPEYQVICDCNNCESCPDGTCAVECSEQICCYDTATGKAVQTIAMVNYCGGQS